MDEKQNTKIIYMVVMVVFKSMFLENTLQRNKDY